MKRSIIILLILIVGYNFLSAQQIGIQNGSVFISVNGNPFAPTDTIRPNDSVVYRVVFENTGTVPADSFSSPVDLVIRNLTTSFTDTLFDNSTPQVYNPGDSIPREYLDMVDPRSQLYAPNGGGAIVTVVWPSVRHRPMIPARDSAQLDLTSGISTSVAATPLTGIAIGPNPSRSLVNIEYGIDKKSIDHVRITDMFGKTVRLISGQPTRISVESLSPGHYWLRFHTTKGFVENRRLQVIR
ncbi:MAG: T9SS type A sorting domain-containing protein [Bacteroidia bacterium]